MTIQLNLAGLNQQNQAAQENKPKSKEMDFSVFFGAPPFKIENKKEREKRIAKEKAQRRIARIKEMKLARMNQKLNPMVCLPMDEMNERVKLYESKHVEFLQFFNQEKYQKPINHYCPYTGILVGQSNGLIQAQKDFLMQESGLNKSIENYLIDHTENDLLPPDNFPVIYDRPFSSKFYMRAITTEDSLRLHQLIFPHEYIMEHIHALALHVPAHERNKQFIELKQQPIKTVVECAEFLRRIYAIMGKDLMRIEHLKISTELPDFTSFIPSDVRLIRFYQANSIQFISSNLAATNSFLSSLIQAFIISKHTELWELATDRQRHFTKNDAEELTRRGLLAHKRAARNQFNPDDTAELVFLDLVRNFESEGYEVELQYKPPVKENLMQKPAINKQDNKALYEKLRPKTKLFTLSTLKPITLKINKLEEN